MLLIQWYNNAMTLFTLASPFMWLAVEVWIRIDNHRRRQASRSSHEG